MLKEKTNSNGSKIREGRYRWIIGILLLVLGFAIGGLVQSERIVKDVTANTINIENAEKNMERYMESIDKQLGKIYDKLDFQGY